jgi:hypothetical protein
MIGTYASFKGKLKVGDRVRLLSEWMERDRERWRIVSAVNDEGFGVDDHNIFSSWTPDGILELLTPSLLDSEEDYPYVQPDAEGRVKRVCTSCGERFVFPPTSETAVGKLCTYSNTDMTSFLTPGDKGAHVMPNDAITTHGAETEEEWWRPIANKMSEVTYDDAMFWKERDMYITKIIAEATRRGYEKAWKEAIAALEQANNKR